MTKQSFSGVSVGDTIKWNSVEHKVVEKSTSQLTLETKEYNDETTLDVDTVDDFFDSDAIQFEVL